MLAVWLMLTVAICVQLGASECPDVKNSNDGWHRMLYSYTHMATVDVKGLSFLCYVSL